MKNININNDSPALGCRIGQAYQVMLSRLDKALADAHLDITASEYLVLRAVYSRPGAQQCDIAGMVGKDKAAICRCVASLVKKGFLDTKLVSHKCLKVYPADKAADARARIMEVAESQHRHLTQHTTAEDLEAFNRILDTIINL